MANPPIRAPICQRDAGRRAFRAKRESIDYYPTVITTFPFLCPCSTYLKASVICSNG